MLPSAEELRTRDIAEVKAVHVSPGALGAEAYGVKSTIERYGPLGAKQFKTLDINEKHFNRDTTGTISLANRQRMYQGLGWEMLDWPVNPDIIINGSDNKIALAAR